MGGAREGTDLLGKYNPGLGAQSFDVDGSAKFVPKGSDLVFNLHYTSVGTPQTDRSRVGLVFAKHPPETRYWMSPGTPAAFNLVIPAGDINAEVVSEVTVGVDGARLVYIQPHMHLRGKAMMLEAILPSGQKQVISLVSDFNFNWMTTYVYADAAAPLLPKGTILKVTAWHDNTSAKKSNPDPNQWVGWGDRTVDEMAHAWVNIVYLKDDDFKIEQDKRRATQTTAIRQQ